MVVGIKITSLQTQLALQTNTDSYHGLLQGQVKQKVSSGGKYVSVNIGPVQVISSEQVLSLSLSLSLG